MGATQRWKWWNNIKPIKTVDFPTLAIRPSNSVLDNKKIEKVQACNISEVLSFQSGLRVETDCQTCNYTQLRINGLSGGYSQILINGNQAISLGAVTAGLEVFIGYPISPATPILLWMEANLVGEGKFVYQSSSEIESITSLVGAGYAGKKAMTSTAGPGFSLMGEGIGLAWMAEIPCVVVNVQRGGPSTGLHTKTEQSDLLTALYPGHGDLKMPVIAPGTVEECFYAGLMSVNWAERYQGPVVLLSEMALSERNQNIPKPDLSTDLAETRQVYQGDNGYLRYDGFELTPMPIPGQSGSYVANGSEHDAMGDTTHLPSRHIQMTERRFSKLECLFTLCLLKC